MAPGALLNQTEFDWSNEETVAQIQEKPYLQYFVGLHSFQWDKPFDASTMIHFSKWLPSDKVNKITEKILAHHEALLKEDNDDHDPPTGGCSDNKWTLMLDATCAPSNICYPQDISLLNESYEKAEGLIDDLSKANKLKKPRTDRKAARKAYLTFVKVKKRPYKKGRKAVKQQLRYVTAYRSTTGTRGCLERRSGITFYTICRIKEQQEMYDNKTSRVDDRIVSFTKPYLRPIVRAKSNSQRSPALSWTPTNPIASCR